MEKIHVKAHKDHIKQLSATRQIYVTKRGSDAGRFGKATPRTTNGDVAGLAEYWNNELYREILRNPFANDRSPRSIKEWTDSKSRIDKHTAKADPSAVYPENEWFWGTALQRVAIYLEGRKALPSSTDLMIESLKETVVEHAETAKEVVKDAASAVTDAGTDLISTIKKGALILGGVIGAAIVLPPVIRAFRDTRRES